MHHLSLQSVGAPALKFLKRSAYSSLVGQVTAVHRRSCYIAWGTDWLCLVHANLGGGPMNLQLDAAGSNSNLFEQIAVSDRVTVSPFSGVRPELKIGNQFRLQYQHASVMSDQISVPCFAHTTSLKRVLARAENLCDFAPTHCVLLTKHSSDNENSARRGTGLDRVLADYLAIEVPDFEFALTDALARQHPHWSGQAERLLGAGAGLTPSSDDLLAGVLLTLRAADYRMLVDTLVEQLRACWHTRTNSISRTLLEQASCGYAGEKIIRVLNGIFTSDDFDPALSATLLNHSGQSSGWDLLAGVCVALRALEASRKNVPTTKNSIRESSYA